MHSKDIFKYKYYQKLSTLHLKKEDINFQSEIGKSAQKIVIHRILQIMYRNPYINYNQALTEKLKLQAQNSITPKQHLLKKGLIIVREGEPIDRESFERINILNQSP